MNAHGLWHFDAHFANILTNGEHLYLTDFGLATSPRFDLSPAERAFLDRNAEHDRGYARMVLVNWLAREVLRPADVLARNAYIHEVTEGADPIGLPAFAADIVRRHAKVAAVMNAFYFRLFGETRTVEFPAWEIRTAIDA